MKAEGELEVARLTSGGASPAELESQLSEQERERQQLMTAWRLLSDLLSDRWKAHLMLPKSLAEGDEAVETEQLERVVKRYASIAKNRKYEALTEKPEFITTYRLLHEYVYGSESMMLPRPVIKRTPEMLRMENQIGQMEAQLATATGTFGGRHPAVEPLRQQLTKAKKVLAQQEEYARGQARRSTEQEVSEMLRQQIPPLLVDLEQTPRESRLAELKARVEVLQHHERTLQAKVGDLERQTHKLGQSSIDIELMRSEITGLEDVLGRVGAEIERTSIELQPKSRIEVISPAEVATPPDPKKRLALTGACGLLGLFAPFALCIAWDMQRKNVNDAESVSEALSVSTFGTIPKIVGDPLRSPPTRIANQRARSIAELEECVDSVAGMMLHHIRKTDHRVFMITSALPGEGKSTVACQLAESLARSGQRVALVDFDLRNPSIDCYMDLQATPGVCEVLHRQTTLRDAIQPCPTDNLSILPAGVSRGNFYERSTGRALEELFDHLRASFDVVILDACPVLPVVDSRIIGTYCDGVILTLVRDKSRLPAAAEACEILQAYGIGVLGTVVIGAGSRYMRGRAYYGDREQVQSDLADQDSARADA